MIHDFDIAIEYVRLHAPEVDTPAPWDLEDNLNPWAIEWGENFSNGMAACTGGGYMVSINYGEKIVEFQGLIEALQYAKQTFN